MHNHTTGPMAFVDEKALSFMEEDPTNWMLDSEISNLLLLKAPYVAYAAMLIYTFMHGK